MSTIQSRTRGWVPAVAAVVFTVVTAVLVWPSAPASATEALRRAVDATVDAGSVSVTFDAAAATSTGTTSSSGSGTVSFASNEAEFKLADSPSFPGGADLRITPDGVYLHAPKLIGTLIGEDKEWLAFPPPESSSQPATTTASTAPPTTAAAVMDTVEALRTQGFEAEAAGQYVVNGAQTDAYRFNTPSGSESVSGTAYVNQETGAINRLEVNTADGSGATSQLKLDMTASGSPVDVATPPAAATVDIATVLAPG